VSYFVSEIQYKSSTYFEQLSNAYGSHTAIVPVMNTTIITSNIFISLHYLEVITYFFLNCEIIKFVWQNNAPTNPPNIAITTHIGSISFVNTAAFANALNLAYLKKLLFPLTEYLTTTTCHMKTL